jgi:DUF2075 family protein
MLAFILYFGYSLNVPGKNRSVDSSYTKQTFDMSYFGVIDCASLFYDFLY